MDSTAIDQLLDIDAPPRLAPQLPHQVNPPPDSRIDLLDCHTPEGSPERPPHTDHVSQRLGNDLDPSKPSPVVCDGVSSYCRAGLDQSPVRASGLNLSGLEEENASDRDHVSRGEEGASSGDMWKENAAAQASFAKGKAGVGRK